MYRILRVLSLCGLSSVYLMGGGACQFDSQGASILPNIGNLVGNPLAGFGL